MTLMMVMALRREVRSMVAGGRESWWMWGRGAARGNMTGMVHANVGQNLLKRNIIESFLDIQL